MSLHPPRCVCPAAGEHPEKSPSLAAATTEALSTEEVDFAIKAQRRRRGGLSELDSGVPPVSGAASHRLNLTAPTDERGGEARQLFTVTSAGGGK